MNKEHIRIKETIINDIPLIHKLYLDVSKTKGGLARIDNEITVMPPILKTELSIFLKKRSLICFFVIPKKHGLFSKLFHPSHSKHLILRSKVPIMSLHE